MLRLRESRSTGTPSSCCCLGGRPRGQEHVRWHQPTCPGTPSYPAATTRARRRESPGPFGPPAAAGGLTVLVHSSTRSEALRRGGPATRGSATAPPAVARGGRLACILRVAGPPRRSASDRVLE